MTPRTVAALALAAVLAACALPTPTLPPTFGPTVARLALPYAGQWQRADWRTPSLLVYPAASEMPVTATVGYP